MLHWLTLLVRVVWLMWSGKWSGLDQFSKWTGKLFYPFLDHAATWLVRSITHQISQEKIFIIQDTSHSIAWIDNSSLNSEVFQFVQYKMAVLADGVEQFTSFVAWARFKFAFSVKSIIIHWLEFIIYYWHGLINKFPRFWYHFDNRPYWFWYVIPPSSYP